ncbi:MAG: hypothetical protein PHI97_26820 [Desulfobulbus sp.]|nr:hypothetical protein [Desulfobulbus sp.]
MLTAKSFFAFLAVNFLISRYFSIPFTRLGGNQYISNTLKPGGEPAATLSAQGLPGISGYMRDTVKIKRGMSSTAIVSFH